MNSVFPTFTKASFDSYRPMFISDDSRSGEEPGAVGVLGSEAPVAAARVPAFREDPAGAIVSARRHAAVKHKVL